MDAIDTAVSQPGSVNAWWDALPEADVPGESADPVVRAEPHTRGWKVSRRHFVKSAVALGGALSLNGLQILSGVKLRPAGATVGSEYTTCAGYENWTGYNNNTLVCVGGSYSYIYCGSDGWFKNGYFDGGYTFFSPRAFCGNGLPARNAWRWSHGSYRYRCADGYFWYWSSGRWVGPQFKICSQWIGYA